MQLSSLHVCIDQKKVQYEIFRILGFSLEEWQPALKEKNI